MNSIRTVVTLCVTALASGCASAPRPGTGDGTLSEVAWLTGSWVGEGSESRSEEHWTEARAGLMLGVNRTIAGGRTVFFEYLRIERRPEGLVYLASPLGRDPPTPFTLIEHGERRAVFENPEHDFPQRVIYWLEDDELHGRIEGVEQDEPKSSQWVWRRAEGSFAP